MTVKQTTMMLVAIIVGAFAAAILLLQLMPAQAHELDSLDKDRIICRQGWCLIHEDALAYVTKDTANRLCGWVK